MTNSEAAFAIRAIHDGHNMAHAVGANITMVTDNIDAAIAVASMFPKSCKVRATKLFGADSVRGYVEFQVHLYENGVNGGVNETGIRRYKTLMKHCAKWGVPVVMAERRYANAFESIEAFEIAAGI